MDIIDTDKADFLAMTQNGRGAFEHLFRKYYKVLCIYAVGILKDQELAEDAVQETFIWFWENRFTVRINSSVRAYLFTSVRHKALRMLQQQLLEQKHSPKLQEFIEYLLSTEYTREEELEIAQIKAIMQELPQQCLKVFLMSCLDGKKYNDIATELGISINTVKTHITKAYRLLRAKVKSDTSILLYLVIHS